MADALTAPPAIGVWDTVCTFGTYQHETVNGKPVISVHDASTCKAMLDDFAAHPLNDIFYDKKHEVVDELGPDAFDREKMQEWGEGDGHAMAWANAMVQIMGGQVTRYEAHAGAPTEPPTADEVLRQSDGSMRPDGVYCLRSRLTPRGADPIDGLSAFSFTSPYYVPEKDGNRLLNLTVTNDPRMRDCALAFQRSGRAIAMSRVSMGLQTDKDIVRQMYPGAVVDRVGPYGYGLNAGQPTYSLNVPGLGTMAANVLTEAEAWRALADRIRSGHGKMENPMPTPENRTIDPEHAAVMKAAGCMEGDAPEVQMQKMAAYARKMEADAATARKDLEEAKPFAGKETPAEEAKEEAKEKAALMARLEAMEAKNLMLGKELEDNKAVMARFSKMEEDGKVEQAAAFARRAVQMGRIRGDHKGTVEQTEKWLAERHVKSAADAEDVLSKEGTFQVSEAVAQSRLTARGAGIGQPDPSEDAKSADDRFSALVAKEMTELRTAGQTENLTATAMSRVQKKHPGLYRESLRPKF